MTRPRTPDAELHYLLARTKRTRKGCKEWLGSKMKDGYGTVGFQGRTWLCHRLVKTLSDGPVHRSLEVMHICDNPACLNLDHLVVGSHSDNMRDMILKGRDSKAKITGADATEIRERYAAGETQRDISLSFGITESNVGYITRGLTWRHTA